MRQGQTAHFGAPGCPSGHPVGDLERQLGKRRRRGRIVSALLLAFEAENFAEGPESAGGRAPQLCHLPWTRQDLDPVPERLRRRPVRVRGDVLTGR